MGPVGVANILIGEVEDGQCDIEPQRVKRGIKSSENREHRPLRGLGAVGLPHMAPGTCTTTFHLLSYLSQHIPRPYRPVDSAHRKHAWALGDTMPMELTE